MIGGRRRSPLLGLAILFGVVLLITPLLGSRSLDLGAALQGDPLASTILWQIRLPRVLLGLLAGSLLALSGMAFQTLFRNPLAEPYTLGVASGAALGTALVFVLGSRLEPGLPWLGLAGFLGALTATGIVLALGTDRSLGSGGAGSVGASGTLLLAGVAVALTCQALILCLQYLSDATQTLRMVRWMMGGVEIVGYREVLWLLPWLVLLLLALMRYRPELDLLLAGEEIASSRGVGVARLRWVLLGCASLAVGALVAVAGPIGFVGLVVPHLARRWVGPSHRRLIPASALLGACFLTLCDLGARTVIAPAELPVGIVTALLGGPFFLWILRQGRRS